MTQDILRVIAMEIANKVALGAMQLQGYAQSVTPTCVGEVIKVM